MAERSPGWRAIAALVGARFYPAGMAAEVAPTRSRASRPIADELGQARPGAEVGCYDSGPVPLLIGVE